MGLTTIITIRIPPATCKYSTQPACVIPSSVLISRLPSPPASLSPGYKKKSLFPGLPRSHHFSVINSNMLQYDQRIRSLLSRTPRGNQANDISSSCSHAPFPVPLLDRHFDVSAHLSILCGYDHNNFVILFSTFPVCLQDFKNFLSGSQISY